MRRAIGIGIVGSLALMLGACAGKPAEVAASPQPKNPLEITTGEDLRHRIKLGQPELAPVAGTLRVAGRIEADETRVARVSAPVTGRITELEAYEGQRVRQGQVLARIYSTELSAAQSEYLKAYTQKQAAERAVSRAKQLLDADVIGAAELQRREADLQQAHAELAAAREQLSVLGFSAEEIHDLQSTRAVHSATQIVSTIDGIILERNATIGQVVQAVQTVFLIADLSKVWLVADVPEQNAGAVRVGKAVQAEIPALPGEKISGSLSFVSAIVNPETRTVRVRMNLANPQHRYKPAMLTTMTLMDGAEKRTVVPATAVVRENNADHVFVETAPNRFTLRRVEIGEDAGEMRVVIGGVTTEDRIVTDGAFHLNNERKRLALGDAGN